LGAFLFYGYIPLEEYIRSRLPNIEIGQQYNSYNFVSSSNKRGLVAARSGIRQNFAQANAIGNLANSACEMNEGGSPMRKKFIAGNWKMYTSLSGAKALAAAVAKGVPDNRVAVAICPPFPWLLPVAEALKGSAVALGAQNCHYAAEGAYTGDVSPQMLVDAGCRYVIVGHSERRHGIGEPDLFLNRKAKASLTAGLSTIFCIGETLAEREGKQTEDVIAFQLAAGLVGVDARLVPNLVVAYEPVWAIGTGKVATPEQAKQAHRFIRQQFAKQFGEEAAQSLLIQYGGSVKPDNAAEILNQPDVDGALVGGASLKADTFLAIVNAAR
jgi:triosephosphate isomerase (TIM)